MKLFTKVAATAAVLIVGVGAYSYARGPAEINYSARDARSLEQLIASDDRPARHRARDKYRHPAETLAFMGLKSDMKIVEIDPGGPGGWYRRIIEPFIESSEGGSYYPVPLNRSWPDEARDEIIYGTIDMAFVFRVHGFLIYDSPAQDHVDDLFKMLKPGGYFGIVDHAGDEAGGEQDPVSEDGYVKESYFRAMAEKAGFVLVKTSDVNRNPLDTKDHPRGVYSLPPTLSGPNSKKYKAIGESDRFTHLYMKPVG
ncbi:MAG: hypothetical protein COB37_03135 [Kordiimonadales bacterium]|nr:MAG: hypothetical protein COB37_03135 [Kordiimonadales bacterium]